MTSFIQATDSPGRVTWLCYTQCISTLRATSLVHVLHFIKTCAYSALANQEDGSYLVQVDNLLLQQVLLLQQGVLVQHDLNFSLFNFGLYSRFILFSSRDHLPSLCTCCPATAINSNSHTYSLDNVFAILPIMIIL